MNVTMTIDSEVKRQAKQILKKRGIKLSFYVDQVLRSMIAKSKREEQEHGIIKKKATKET